MPRFCVSLLIAGMLLTATGPTQAAVPATTPSDSTLYAIQLRASEDRALIEGMRDSLAQRGLPVYAMRIAAGESVHYRLRVGPFRSREDARRLADFLGFSDYWLTDVKGESDAFARVVTQVIIDAVRMEPVPPYIYIGRRHSFVLVRLPVSANTTLPPRALLYVPDRNKPLRFKHMTGFQESALALLFGEAERVFVNPVGRPIGAFSEEIAAFSRSAGLSRHVVRDGLTFYNDSVAVRFTLLRAYDFSADTLITYTHPGFDYVTADGERKRFTGRIEQRRLLWEGNENAWRLLPRGAGNLATDRTALYVRPTERGDVMELGIAFFVGEE